MAGVVVTCDHEGQKKMTYILNNATGDWQDCLSTKSIPLGGGTKLKAGDEEKSRGIIDNITALKEMFLEEI